MRAVSSEGEHRPFKPGVAGSSPARLTTHLRPCRLAWPRTPPFQGGSTGSNPVGGAFFLHGNLNLKAFDHIFFIPGWNDDVSGGIVFPLIIGD